MNTLSNPPVINVVWFKRDLRLKDHQPLAAAVDAGLPLLLLYIYEDALIDDPHYAERHWRFVAQSLRDMNSELADFGARVVIQRGNALAVFEALQRRYTIRSVFSHQETGLEITFARDRALADFFTRENIIWQESQNGAVHRPCHQRQDWRELWMAQMRAPQVHPRIEDGHYITDINDAKLPHQWLEHSTLFQEGGRLAAEAVMASFFQHRGKQYQAGISSPDLSRTLCSRLSPYLAWGNLSLREVYHTTLRQWGRPGWHRSLQAFASRLHWHCHFIQKFESECEMEFRPANQGYIDFPYRKEGDYEHDLQAWQQGKTGFPLVDACMRCLIATGYLNFRMRAMLVSFLCHHLNIHWRHAATHLAQLFLDFEPGIHYPQIHMQASVTGTNTIRLYNPVKQSVDKDADAIFISEWLPELHSLPVPLRHQPWQLSPMEEILYDFKPGQDYPLPIVDLDAASKAARERLWAWRDRKVVRQEATRILRRHVAPRTTARSKANRNA